MHPRHNPLALARCVAPEELQGRVRLLREMLRVKDIDLVELSAADEAAYEASSIEFAVANATLSDPCARGLRWRGGSAAGLAWASVFAG